jgi:thiol-disulfide isomerase/thioredoxin
MANVVEVLRKYIRPYYQYMLILILIIVFVFVGQYVYNRMSNKNESFDVANDISDGREQGAVIYFFHADWCPHCKKAQPEWESFKQSTDGKNIDGYKISCVDVNCTNEDDAKTTEYINKFNIDSYPTVKLIKDGNTIDFESRITTSSLDSFLSTMLND